MSIETTGYYIFGITIDGNTFRPTDWVERIASVYGTYKNKQHLKYNPMIKPALYKNNRCLFVDSKMTESEPDVFKHIMDFAYKNSLKIEIKKQTVADGIPAVQYKNVA